MSEYKDTLKYILSNFSDTEALDKIKVETLKEEMVDAIEDASMGISLDELGLTIEDVNNVEYMFDISADDIESLEQVNMASTKLVKLYRYISTGQAKSSNSRTFCKRLVKRTELSMMRKEDIENLNSSNPGQGRGGSNMYSVFNWRGGVNCQHVWVKYFFNADTKNLVKAPSDQQPRQAGFGKVPNA